MLVEINDKRCPRWFLSCAVGLWRGRIGTVALPLVDFLQRSSHERCLVVLGQAFGVAERRDALLIGQHAEEKSSNRRPIASHSDAIVRSAAARNSAFNLAKSISIGLKSGE